MPKTPRGERSTKEQKGHRMNSKSHFPAVHGLQKLK